MKTMDGIPLLSGAGALGHVGELRDDAMSFLQRLARDAGDLCRVRFFYKTVLFVSAPGLIQEVLVDSARSFEKSSMARYLLYPLAGEGLFTSRGALWRRQRRLMAPLFQPAQLGRYAGCMVDCTERTVDTWRDGATVDLSRETTRITMSIAGKTLFGADTFSEADELGAALTTALGWVGEHTGRLWPVVQTALSRELERTGDRIKGRAGAAMQRAAARLFGPLLLFGEGDQRYKEALAVLDGRVQRMIDERRAAPGPEDDLLSRLLSASDDDEGGRMSDRQVRDEVLTLFIAGHETTATALAWALYLLTMHPEAYRRAQAEADALGHRPGHADLQRLPYAQRVFKEALRLYPPVPIFSREAYEDVAIGGHLVPRGTIIFLGPFATHRRADLWPDPERFDPERFLPAAEEARPRHAFLPFSGGPRVCIGQHFALMEGTLVLASLLQRADFALATPGPIDGELQVTLRPRGGVPMRIRRRAGASL